MKNRFFTYSGSKFKYTELINPIINKTNKNIYAEPFVGSGAILFNLEKDIYKTFKNIEYEYFKEKEKFILDKFGFFKAKHMDIESKNEAKENYYNFRNWFNKNYWNTNSIEEGIYCYMLSNMVINSMLRFGPNGMNQSFGNRYYMIDEKTFSNIKNILEKTTIMNGDYKEVFRLYPDSLFFLDPPYFSQDSSYKGFTEAQFKEFLDLIKDKEYIYTDILNEHNSFLDNKILVRNMSSTAPSSSKQKTGNIEYVFCSKELKDLNESCIDYDEW